MLGTVSRVEEVLYGSALPENLPLVPLYFFSPAKYKSVDLSCCAFVKWLKKFFVLNTVAKS